MKGMPGLQKRYLTVAALWLACAPAVVGQTWRGLNRDESNTPPARVYVKLRPGTRAADRSALHASRGHELERTIDAIDMHVVRVPPGKTADDVCARYERHPLVEYCTAEVAYELQLAPSDPWYLNGQRPLQRLGAETAWEITTGSPSVLVAVIDTGLDASHFDFAGRIARGEIRGAAFGVDDWSDTLGHGTLVTGVIAAEANNGLGIAGGAWGSSVLAINGFNGIGHQIDAILFAADNGARVISMSYGAYTPTPDLAALQYAFDRGVVLVAAAGNQDTDAKFYPAAHEIVIAVTGVDGSERDCNYGRGDWIDLAAPCITLSTVPVAMDSNGDGLTTIAGTSIAAPFVASAAALVLSANPDLTPAQVTEILRSTADDIGEPGFDLYFGHGRVNYGRAVLRALETAPYVDTTQPVVAIRAPASGSLISGMSDVLVEATDDSRISRVDLHVDGAFLSGDTVPPHEWTLDTTVLSEGSHTLSAVATDLAGNSAASEAITVFIDNSLPAVDILTPAEGSSVSGAVPVSSAPSDPAGILRVVYLLDGTEQVTVDTPPWTWSWDTTSVADGEHVLEAVAHDAAGHQARASVSVAVTNGAVLQRTETFTGSVTKNHPVAEFRMEVGSVGPLEIEVLFSAGQQGSLDCELLAPSGFEVCRQSSGSPLRMKAKAESSGTHSVRIRRVLKNTTFTLKVTHP